MRKTLFLVFAATAVTAGITIPGAAVATTPDTQSTISTESTVRWGPCPEDVAVPDLECSTLDVPLDYRNPHGRKIELAISRLPSKNPEKRRGVLLTNPGGPGYSMLNFPALLAAGGLSQEVRDAYDVIGFDPRGVGRSTPVTCDLTPEQQARGNFPPYAHTSADVTREAGYARTIAEQCANSSTAWMLPYTTTANTARDMDRIRAALGERKASYFGGSYGTYLGAVYTTLFPDTSDRVVLDSNVGPGGYDVTAMRMFARGMADRFPDFAAYLAEHPEYGLGTTLAQVTAKFDELVARLEKQPVQGMDATLFRATTFDKFYNDTFLPELAAIWQAVDKGSPVPPPTSTFPENAMASRFYVICGDSRWPSDIRDYQRAVAADRARYPMLGGSSANIGPCAYWPKDHVEPPVRITDRGPANVLLVQAERDPGSPLAGAEKMRQALGSRAKMVTVDHGGHGVYPWLDNTCLNEPVTAFLTTGRRPAQDLDCAAEPGK